HLRQWLPQPARQTTIPLCDRSRSVGLHVADGPASLRAIRRESRWQSSAPTPRQCRPAVHDQTHRGDHLAIFGTGALRNYDDCVTWAFGSTADQSRCANTIVENVKDSFVAKRVLGNQNDMRLAGDAGPKREMAGMSAHHFDDLHPPV